MIRYFSCHDFRNLNIDNLSIGKRINLLIGPNNSGKTNFIKAISFLANMLIAGDNNAFESSFLYESGQNGWDKLVNRSLSLPAKIRFKWTIRIGEEDIDYYFSFVAGRQNADFSIVEEVMECTDIPNERERAYNFFDCHRKRPGIGYFSTVRRRGQKNKRIEIEVSDRDSVLLQFKDKLLAEKKLYDDEDIRKKVQPIVEEMSSYYKKFCSYSSSQFDLNKIRRPSDIKAETLRLNRDAGNFTNVLNALIAKDLYLKDAFDEKLRELFPRSRYEKIMTNISSEYDKMVFRLAYGGNQYDLTDVSDGTVKALVLNLIINLPINGGMSMLAIDEPELNLHPAWQKVVADWIVRSPNIRQCFISTHSPDFLDRFTEEFMEDNVSLYVFSATGDIRRVHYSNIREELDGWQLGDLYRTGDPELGGWPW